MDDRKLGEKFFAVCGPRAPAYDVFQQPVYDFGCDFSFPDVLLGDAYVITKYEFPGRDVFYSFAVIVMMIPTMGSMASTYKMYNAIGLINTYTGYFIFACGGFGSYFLIMYGFYKNLSWTYAEAAQIDGAGISGYILQS